MIHVMMVVVIVMGNERPTALAANLAIQADFDNGLGKIIAMSQLDEVLVGQAVEVVAVAASVLPDGLDAVRPITAKLITMEIEALSQEGASAQDSVRARGTRGR